MFNWEGVTEFVAVAEAGSFTAASKQLGVSTAQVSRQISALEARLSTKLFYRTTRKVSVTEAGQIYYHHCRQLLDGLEEAERAVTNLQGTPKGKLKMTAPITYGERKILPLVNDFVAKNPQLEVQCILTNTTLDLVDEGLDLAIRLGKLSGSTMMARQLSTRQIFTCASPAYLERHGEPQNLNELSDHNCLLGTLDYWRFEENGKERSLRVSGNVRYNSGTALTDAALKHLGIIQLPGYYVQPQIDCGKLKPILSTYQPPDEGIWALYPHNRHLSTKVRMLLEYFAQHLNEGDLSL